MTRNLFALLALGAATFAACTPAPQPFSGAWSYDDSRIAVDQSFPEPWLNGTAHCIVERESHYDPNARNGQYRGIFQLGANYDGTLSVTNDGNVWNPYTNAQAARAVLDARGNWSAWSTAGGC